MPISRCSASTWCSELVAHFGAPPMMKSGSLNRYATDPPGCPHSCRSEQIYDTAEILSIPALRSLRIGTGGSLGNHLSGAKLHRGRGRTARPPNHSAVEHSSSELNAALATPH